jgi:hypothetical protein
MKVHELHHSLVLFRTIYFGFIYGSLDSFMHSVWTRFGFYCVVGKESFVVSTMHALTCSRVSWIWHHLPKKKFTNQRQFLSCFLHLFLGFVSMWPTMPTIIWQIHHPIISICIRTCKMY